MSVCESEYHLCASALIQKRTSDPLELELQTFICKLPDKGAGNQTGLKEE